MLDKRPEPLVGLIGRKRSGKDTVAGFLRDEYGFARLAFADRLKAAVYAVDPIVRFHPVRGEVRLRALVDAMGWESAKEIPEVRRLLQEFGLGVREACDPLVWVRPVLTEAGFLTTAGRTPVVVTDVRFENEAEAILDRGGVLVRVDRPGLPDDGDRHVSETALADFPVAQTVRNDRGLADLRVEVSRVALALSL